MINYKDIPLLTQDDIEVKVKQVSESGAVALLYKTARTDYKYLNELFGIYGWSCDYREVKGNLYCTISIYDEEKNQWIAKTNCGVESRADEDGNEKKGEASDSLKRAGFTLGIGVELYSAPFIFLKVATKLNDKKKYELANKYQKFRVKTITYTNEREIDKLVIVDSDTNKVVFSTMYMKGEDNSVESEKVEPTSKVPEVVSNKDTKVDYGEVVEDKNNDILEDEASKFATTSEEEDRPANVLSKATRGRIEILFNKCTKEQQEAVNRWLERAFNKFSIYELSEYEATLTISVLEKSLDKEQRL